MKPILFNTEMVRAILDGRKTTTRRIIKCRGKIPLECGRDKFYTYVQELNGKPFRGAGFYKDDDIFIADGVKHTDATYFRAPYVPGDILYVRETWQRIAPWNEAETEIDWDKAKYYYAADGTPDIEMTDDDGFYVDHFRWSPSIHMPKEAARIFLRVTDVHAERLQDITEDGAGAEGAINNHGFIHSPDNEYDTVHTAREHFSEIWNSTVKKDDLYKYSWNKNPWVWVIEFERVAKPNA